MPAKKITPEKPAPKKTTPKTTVARQVKRSPVPPVSLEAQPELSTLPEISEPATVVEALPAVDTMEPVEAAPALTSAPAPTASSQPTNEERNWAMLAHLSVLLNLVTGLLGPIASLVIYLVYRDRSRYVAYHALQALIQQLLWWIGGGLLAATAWAVSSALAVVIVGLLLMPIACLITFLPLYALVTGIIAAVQTSQGQDYKYWLIGSWVRRTLTG